MTNTPHITLPLLMANQAQKEIIVNTALIKIDALLNSGVITRSLNFPPKDKQDGDLYIVSLDPKEEWEGKANYLTYHFSGWNFIKPNKGALYWINDENGLFYFDGNEWVKIISRLDK